MTYIRSFISIYSIFSQNTKSQKPWRCTYRTPRFEHQENWALPLRPRLMNNESWRYFVKPCCSSGSGSTTLNSECEDPDWKRRKKNVLRYGCGHVACCSDAPSICRWSTSKHDAATTTPFFPHFTTSLKGRKEGQRLNARGCGGTV